MSATRDRAKSMAFREQLFQFVVNDRGVMIAVYNTSYSCIIKVKSVTAGVGEDWHFLLRSEVIAVSVRFLLYFLLMLLSRTSGTEAKNVSLKNEVKIFTVETTTKTKTMQRNLSSRCLNDLMYLTFEL